MSGKARSRSTLTWAHLRIFEGICWIWRMRVGVGRGLERREVLPPDGQPAAFRTWAYPVPGGTSGETRGSLGANQDGWYFSILCMFGVPQTLERTQCMHHVPTCTPKVKNNSLRYLQTSQAGLLSLTVPRRVDRPLQPLPHRGSC